MMALRIHPVTANRLILVGCALVIAASLWFMHLRSTTI